ncbi:MAG: hypothetical protein IJN49_09060 [Clostridia bacterium]|nr:hypothetical protein [Clostridia bacterium]
MNKLVKNEIFDFKKLYKCVSSLIRCASYFDEKERNLTIKLEKLARKIEVSNYIHQRNIIAIAGMQGSGKSTLIKTLYNLPDNLLAIGSGRSERTPVFITESSELNEGEYKANEVILQDGKKEVNEININEIRTKSKSPRGIAYIELFVPKRYFSCENAGFVLLPGFEKNADGFFDEDYNSIIQYALYFSNAVILATDDAGIANRDISTLTEILLNNNFNLSNLVFAITKCDTASIGNKEEMVTSLIEACEDSGLPISKNNIVTTGLYKDDAENEKWIQEFADVINTEGVLDFDSARRNYLYYRPMVDEMLYCAEVLEKELEIKSISTETESPIYQELKNTLEKKEEELDDLLSDAVKTAQKRAEDKFASESEKIDKKHLKSKKFLLFNKNYKDNYEDRQAISKVCSECLIDSNGKSFFIEEVRKKVMEPNIKDSLVQNFNTPLLPANEEQEQISNNEYNIVMNQYVSYYLVSTDFNKPVESKIYTPDIAEISETTAIGLYGTFFSALFAPQDLDKKLKEINIKASSIPIAIKSAHLATPNPLLTTFGLVDMLDGKSDIITAIVTAFSKKGTEAAAIASTTSTILGVASVAIVVAMLTKTGINIYNATVDEQKKILEAWEKALKNSIEEQKNECLDLFHDASQKLLDHVQNIHSKRMHIGDTQERLINAKYAIQDIKYLANKFNDNYAVTLE